MTESQTATANSCSGYTCPVCGYWCDNGTVHICNTLPYLEGQMQEIIDLLKQIIERLGK